MKNHSFRYLVIGQSLANAGDVFYIVALISIVYDMTGSTFFVSLVPLIHTFSTFLSGLIAPLIIDKYKLKNILLYSQFSKMILLFLLAIYSLTFVSLYSIAILFILVGCISFLDGWASPARNSMIPRLVPTDNLIKANSLVSLSDQSIRLAGWSLGGILLALLHPNGLFWITFSLFILSTGLMSLLVDPKQKDTVPREKTSIKQALFEGWQIIFKNRALRTIHLLIIFEAIANTVWLSAILYVFIQERLKVGVQWWGYINTSLFVGILLAGIIGYKSAFLKERLVPTVIVSSFFVFLTTLFFGFNVFPWLALLLIGFNGLFDQLKGIFLQSIVQSSLDDHLLPKVYTAQSALITICFGLSTALVGIVSDLFNVVYTFIGASVFLIISFVIVINMKDTLQMKHE
ncbi:MFS transporter [Sporosarcina sp. HYO08]|uniref:MFS transporter n=1 Tax=Sporosarcina sp. HYO08 TaxID=1759557 RepID=UPI00079B68F3|nr:MFS transporter [Sporosarcina sp. HYO08]KXH81974.1 MFS transporter [Sporosarcina sp. HYO08]